MSASGGDAALLSDASTTAAGSLSPLPVEKPREGRSFCPPRCGGFNSKGIEMLVLSRKPSEVIHIGNDIKVTVVRIGPNNVRIGIDAPCEMNVVRGELLEEQEGGET